MFYQSPIQLSHVYGPIAHGVLQGGPKMSNANGGFVSVLLTHLFISDFGASDQSSAVMLVSATS